MALIPGDQITDEAIDALVAAVRAAQAEAEEELCLRRMACRPGLPPNQARRPTNG